MIRVIELIAPASGGQTVYTVNGSTRWKIVAATWSMAAGVSGAANPVVDVITPQNLIMLTASGPNQMAALETVSVQTAVNYPHGKNTAGGSIQMPLPDTWLYRDGTVRVRFDGGGVSTQISGVILTLDIE